MIAGAIIQNVTLSTFVKQRLKITTNSSNYRHNARKAHHLLCLPTTRQISLHGSKPMNPTMSMLRVRRAEL